MEKDTILVVDDQTDLVHGLRRTLSIYGTIEKAIESFTLAYLNRLLGRTAGNVSAAAQLSGMKRQSLQKIIKRYGIDRQQLRS